MAAVFTRVFFEPALAAIGKNIVESAVAGSDEVGSVGRLVGGRWVGGCWFIHHQSNIGAGVPVGGAFGDFDAFLEGEGGQ